MIYLFSNLALSSEKPLGHFADEVAPGLTQGPSAQTNWTGLKLTHLIFTRYWLAELEKQVKLAPLLSDAFEHSLFLACASDAGTKLAENTSMAAAIAPRTCFIDGFLCGL